MIQNYKKKEWTGWIWLWIRIILAFPVTTQSVCPNDFPETGQSDLPPVEWDGEVVSGGGTVYYCPGRIKCKFKCMVNSDFSPSLYINGQCLAVTEVSKAIPGTTVMTNHPNYTVVFSCASVAEFRCVNGENQYSPGYTVELTSDMSCGFIPELLPGDSTDAPGSTPSNTTVSDDNAPSAVLLGTSVSAVSVAFMVMVVVATAAVCAIMRKRWFINGPAVSHDQDAHTASEQSDVHLSEVAISDPSSVTEVANSSSASLEWISGSYSVGDNAPEHMDTSSSITVVVRDLTSESRDLPDGGEELLPFPTQMEDVAGNSDLVPGIPEY